jgi:hypothetical protein
LGLRECSVCGRSADAAPERLLVRARVERWRIWPEHQRQNDIDDDRRREEEDETEHGDEPYHDWLDADVVGDAGANTGKDAAISVAPQAMTRAAVGPDHLSFSCPHAPARRVGVQHLLERFDPPFHPPRALPQLAQRLLVVTRQATRLPPLRDVVTEYPDERVGGNEVHHVDVRVIAATNVDLPALADIGRFRSNLLDRLAFDVVTVPSLRERASISGAA